MAGKLTALAPGILLITANVGSVFEEPEVLQTAWLREFHQTVERHKPHFLALHCQEVGGKNYVTSMSHMEVFIKALTSHETMEKYDATRIYIDGNYKSQEHFTALGSFYFIHETLRNIQQFDFKAKKFRNVAGKDMRSELLESTPLVEKEKFSIEYHPELKWSRKGYIRTRWAVGDCAFDLVNIHLFHDACNLQAWDISPSVYSQCRQKALKYVLDRIGDKQYEKLPLFIFGDFNFRLDSREVIKSRLCPAIDPEIIRSGARNDLTKLTFHEQGNHGNVILQVEKKVFDYVNQDIFREDNGTWLLEFDVEPELFKGRLEEMEITFPPSYPYSEDRNQGSEYMNTRLPAWCDRILMSPSAKELMVKGENDELLSVYDNIGPNVCMGDHKPVFLSFQLSRAGNFNAQKCECCVVL